MNRVFTLTILSLVLCIQALPVFARDSAKMQQKLTEKLDLTDQQASRLFPIFKESREACRGAESGEERMRCKKEQRDLRREEVESILNDTQLEGLREFRRSQKKKFHRGG